MIPTCPWNEDIVKTGQLAMSTPWQRMSDSLPSSVSACPSPASPLPAQLHVDGNETVPTIANNTVSCYVLLVSFTIINIQLRTNIQLQLLQVLQ